MSGLFLFIMEQLYDYFLESSGVCTDTRNLFDDCFFVALKGPSFNGNAFAKEAIASGAKYALVDEREYVDENKGIFLVDDCLEILQKLAQHHRKQFDIPIIGITGSNGKTSTKELIHEVLSQSYNVLATQGNLNNHIGVPLTLLKLKHEHEIAIIEMGANHFGDIKELCDITIPNFGIITNIGKAHLEGFKNFEGVLKTKKELYHAIEQNEGLVVYNADDDLLKEHLPINTMLMSYGTSNGEVMGTLKRLTPYVELTWESGGYQSPVIETNLIGEYNFYNFLAAIAFGVLFDVEGELIDQAISRYVPTNNRSQVHETENNTLILDCYNANPTSMQSALRSFAKIDAPQKLVVIGDMFELGNESQQEHQAIVDLMEELKLKGVLVGKEFSKIQSSCVLQSFENTKQAIAYFQNSKPKQSLILLKASRGIGLEVLKEYL